MILDVNNLQQMYAIYISCLLLRTVEKEIIHLNETLKKENEKNSKEIAELKEKLVKYADFEAQEKKLTEQVCSVRRHSHNGCSL